MAGFNPLTQKSAKNTIIEYGTIDFVTSGLTVEVPTRLNTIFMGIGTVTDDNLVANCDRVITSGKVTFTRESSGTSGAELQYIIGGY
jgi:RNA polymerase-interacting CarD/CdnL/TRCF family regulator